ncbi:MAG: hypothetical protein IPH62_16405 [Ignavibacteriae bacterium]|nr:hypothetical protein [Ignavibacteriota bacterium]
MILIEHIIRVSRFEEILSIIEVTAVKLLEFDLRVNPHKELSVFSFFLISFFGLIGNEIYDYFYKEMDETYVPNYRAINEHIAFFLLHLILIKKRFNLSGEIDFLITSITYLGLLILEEGL